MREIGIPATFPPCRGSWSFPEGARPHEGWPRTGPVNRWHLSAIDTYTAALNAHDAQRVAVLYTEDATVEQMVRGGNVFHGRQEIAGLITSNLQGLPDLTVTTESVIVGNDRIAWAWVYHGTYTGQYPGLPAGQGQPIELRGVSLLTLRDGQITHESIYYDNYGFLVETGALPSSATPEVATPTS